MKKTVSSVVFWGAVWGIAEATLGYVLHMFSVSLGWLIWFPLAYYFMNRVYKNTGKLESILYASIIAASIKLINLLMPTSIDRVINPAVSIILEGAVVYAAYKLLEGKWESLAEQLRYLWSIVVSMAWRLLYIVYVLFLPSYLIKISPISGVEPSLKFFLLESAANSVFIYSYIRLLEGRGVEKKINNLNFSPIFSFVILGLAFLIQWVI